jgi:tRNA pseudouridine13 synthase
LQALDLTGDEFRDLPFGIGRGERRPLRVPVTEASAALADGGLRLSFALPKGAYATAVLREMLDEAIWFRDDED